jgi:hypothetical protein
MLGLKWNARLAGTEHSSDSHWDISIASGHLLSERLAMICCGSVAHNTPFFSNNITFQISDK